MITLTLLPLGPTELRLGVTEILTSRGCPLLPLAPALSIGAINISTNCINSPHSVDLHTIPLFNVSRPRDTPAARAPSGLPLILASRICGTTMYIVLTRPRPTIPGGKPEPLSLTGLGVAR